MVAGYNMLSFDLFGLAVGRRKKSSKARADREKITPFVTRLNSVIAIRNMICFSGRSIGDLKRRSETIQFLAMPMHCEEFSVIALIAGCARPIRVALLITGYMAAPASDKLVYTPPATAAVMAVPRSTASLVCGTTTCLPVVSA